MAILQPIQGLLHRRAAVLLGLVLLCLVPRIVMAWKLTAICPDGVLYFRLAESLEHGRMGASIERLGFNLYPVVLAVLHRAGLNWESAGAWWGIWMSSLTVLPLYGLIRRQFDERIALVAGFLYAVHPELIRWSPEIIRDSTFWLLFTLALYLTWRAVEEVRWPLFLAAGATIALAISTRIEGLVLTVPLVLWALARAIEQGDRRLRWSGRWSLGAGVLICLSIYPLQLAASNGLWYRQHSAIALARTEPLALAHGWAQAPAADTTAAVAPGSPPRLSPGRMIVLFTSGMVRGITPVVLVLWLIGAVWQPRAWRRADQLALVVMSLGLLAAIWIHLWWAHVTCPRYFLPMTLVMLPLAAIGLLRVSEALTARYFPSATAGLPSSVQTRVGKPSVAPSWSMKNPGLDRLLVRFAPAAIVAAIGLGVAWGTDCRFRTATVELGRWVHDSFGESPVVFGPDGVAQVVAHYARARCESVPLDESDGAVVERVRTLRPDVVLLPADRKAADGGQSLLRQVEGLGFIELDRSPFCGGLRKVHVLIGTPIESQVVQVTEGRHGWPAHPCLATAGQASNGTRSAEENLTRR